MFGFLTRRVSYSIIVLFIILVLVFVMVNLVGDPARLMLPPQAPHAQYVALRHSLGLDQPFVVRLWDSLSHWVRGDFGDSLWQGVPSLPLALGRIPATLYLTAIALLISIPIALALGVWSALSEGSASDFLVSTFSLFGISIAPFWLGLMLIVVVAVHFGWLPTSGYGGLQYAILPAIALAARPLGRLSQIARSSLLEELEKPYVVALEAKGLSRRSMVTRHALKNAAIPIVTVLGDELATFVNGAVVIETIFAWPGIGLLFIQAIQQRDLPLVEACVFAVALMTMVINLAVDLSYRYIDPRVQFD
jgi:peptide/nickel transport system permease protein